MTTTTTTRTKLTPSTHDLEVVKSLTQTTMSGKIRALKGMGWTTAQIGRGLGIRYQWVRNVLVTPTKKVSQ